MNEALSEPEFEEFESPYFSPSEGKEAELFLPEIDQNVRIHSISEDETGRLSGKVSAEEVAGHNEEFVVEKGTRWQAGKEFVLRNKKGIALSIGALAASVAAGFTVRHYRKRK